MLFRSLTTAASQTRQGRISVFVAATDAGSIPKVTFRVRDSGSGIDAIRVAGTMSFSGAHSRDEGSPEAALAAAGAECRAAGGSFVVQSSAGEGTKVSFALPQRDVGEPAPDA